VTGAGRGQRVAMRSPTLRGAGWPMSLVAAIGVGLVGAFVLVSRTAAASQPSFLIFVFDTTRVDAVSAYGKVGDTTPEVDKLAAAGLRYRHAYSNAPWTLPAHVTLLTGLLTTEHTIGFRGVRLPDEVLTLAERLRDAGYETASFSENPFVTEIFNMMQGFSYMENNLRSTKNADLRAPKDGEYHVGEAVQRWLRQRGEKRPFFMFVNVMQAHAPYPVTPWNRWLRQGVSIEDAGKVDQRVHARICSRLPPPKDVEILRALYHDGVAADDRKLAAVLGLLKEAGLTDQLITIVTSDHGEHFGEHRLMEHNFSVREALLHIPLVVHGVPGVEPAVLDQPVQLADVTPSILRWAGLRGSGAMKGRPLPTRVAEMRPEVTMAAQYTEPDNVELIGDAPEWLLQGKARTTMNRRGCAAEDRVFGDLIALVRYPIKAIWYERHPMQVFDLASDPDERVDLARTRPDLVVPFQAEVDRVRAARRRLSPTKSAAMAPTIPPEVRERMRQLGYADPSTNGSSTPTTGMR